MNINRFDKTISITSYYAFGLLSFTAIFFLPFIFETNDDSKMMMFLSGGYSGSPEYYAVYLHPLLSNALACLYNFCGQLPWYPLFWFLFFYLAYVGYVKTVLWRIQAPLHQFLLILVFLGFSIHSLFCLQFTVVAGVLAFSGFLLLLSHYQGLRISKLEIWFGYLLCFFSILVRRESFYLFTIGFGLLTVIEFGWKKLYKILLLEKWMALGVLLLLISIPIYESAKGYQDYIQFNTARHKVLDHPVLHRSDIDKILQTDLFYFKTWYFKDNPSVTLSTLYEWEKWLDSYYFEMNHFRHSVAFFLFEVRHNKFIIFLGFFSLAIFFLLGRSKSYFYKAIVFVACWACLTFTLNYFYMVHARVQSILVLMILGAVVFLYEAALSRSKSVIAISAFFIVALVYHLNNVWNGIEQRSEKKQLIGDMEVQIPEDAIYFMDWRSWNVRHLDPKKLHQHDRRLLSLGWTSYHPADLRLLESKGFTKLQDIRSFYYIYATVEEDFKFPNYMNHLQRDEDEFRFTIVAENEAFKLVYYELP